MYDIFPWNFYTKKNWFYLKNKWDFSLPSNQKSYYILILVFSPIFILLSMTFFFLLLTKEQNGKV